MSFRKTKVKIKPKKLKKKLFAESWCKGASNQWKINYYDAINYKKTNGFHEIFASKEKN